VLGDAVCSLNPLYAQGMSMALREAALLGRIVDRHGTRGVGVAFLREATPLVDAAWTLATSADLGHRRSPGRGRSPGGCSIATSVGCCASPTATRSSRTLTCG
jgi:2-polyprenyl-6-methoxyphenol hydroxylase-like FAD-dependent oxidoreductase